MIPEAAVEAAAKTSFERANPRTPWAEVEPHWKAAYVANMQAALEACAPHIAAQVLREAVDAFPLETIAAPDNAVMWLRRRAEHMSSQTVE